MVLIPFLYLIGMGLKNFPSISNKWIPVILGIVGIVMAMMYELTVREFCLEAVYTAILQGIFCAGCAVYANQLLKQVKKDE